MPTLEFYHQSTILTTTVTVRQIAESITLRLIQELPAEEVWLFGSQARGEAGPNSDFDLLAIVGESSKTRYERAVTARKTVSDFHIPKDIIVLTRQEWEKDLRVPSSLSSTVLREGIPLHHAA